MEIKPRTKEILSILNENRLHILKLLFECNDALCGCDLAEKIEIPKNLISHHIKVLRDAGFITETRCGKNKNYLIPIEMRAKVAHILTLVEMI